LHRQATAHLYADWELGIPFVPGAIAVYFSISLVFALPVLALDECGLSRMARAFAGCTCVAGVMFVAMPFRIGFERPPSVAGFESIYSALYRFDAPFNTVPSLHIAYSTLILWTLASGTASRPARLALVGWWLAICASVLLVHQHHVVDVVTGIALGAASTWRLVFKRRDRA
jgi:membrane-associated phospholipid phosphatase